MQRHELLRRPHREPLSHNALSKTLHGRGVGKAQQGPGVPGRQYSGGQPALDKRRQLHETQRVRDLRARARNPLRELRMRAVEVLEQLLVRGRLLQWIELNSVQVLQERVPQQLIVRRVTDDGGDRLEPGLLGRPQTPLSHNQLIAGIAVVAALAPAHDNGLKQTDLLDRRGELGDVVLVEHLPGLMRIGRDHIHGQVCEGRPRDGHERLLLVVGLRGLSAGLHGIRLLGLDVGNRAHLLRPGLVQVNLCFLDRLLLLRRFT